MRTLAGNYCSGRQATRESIPFIAVITATERLSDLLHHPARRDGYLATKELSVLRWHSFQGLGQHESPADLSTMGVRAMIVL